MFLQRITLKADPNDINEAYKLQIEKSEKIIIFDDKLQGKLLQDFTISLMDKAEKVSGRKLSFIKLTQPPVTGCVNWIFQQYK